MKNLMIAALFLSSSALAQEPAAPAEPAEATTPPPAAETVAEPEAEAPAPFLEVSLKGGVHLPQVMNALQTSFDGVLKVGYGLPFLRRKLQVFVDLSYTQPSHQYGATDPRLGETGAGYTSTLTLRDFAMSLGLQLFILDPSRFIVPYVGAGLRVHFLRADVTASGGGAFGDHAETDTRAGFIGMAGAGLKLGPGRVLAELAVGYAPVSETVTGVTNVGALSLLVGYGLLF